MLYLDSRDSFVTNAKIALKLADTDVKLWADLVATDQTMPQVGSKVRHQSAAELEPLLDEGTKTPRRPTITFAPSPVKTERKSQFAAAGTAARLFLRRSLHGFNSPKKHQCAACQETARDANPIRLPCGHHYDVSCLRDLVQAAIGDETLFPPRCCKEDIPSTVIEAHLDLATVKLFSQKTLENATPRRVYCSDASCSAFLGPRHTSKAGPPHIYVCSGSKCSRRTCGRCCREVKKHLLHSCRTDDVPKRLVQLGKAQQCSTCDRLIELRSGCYHVKCVCKAQFCYKCGAKWKTCKCPMWDEATIVTREPPNIAPRSLRPPPPVPSRASKPALVQAVPVLPPVPRLDPVRQTWIQTTTTTEREPPPPLAQRRGRSSAPAQLQSHIPIRETVMLQGFHAQERRAKLQKETNPNKPAPRPPSSREPQSPGTRLTVDSRRLDALEEQIDELIHTVQHYPCQHNWRAALLSAKRGSCACGNPAVYGCSHCTKLTCTSCRLGYRT